VGLDLIPHKYACKTAGTAVMTADDRIDCATTMDVGGCPWKVAAEGRGTPVYGMMGTSCWYRGKVGSYMLMTLDEAGFPTPSGLEGGFYGVDGAEPNLSPEYCKELARFMEDHVEAYVAEVMRQSLVDGKTVDLQEEVDRYRYAAWWVRWAGEQCDGADAWW
jgi:hypothetical protein